MRKSPSRECGECDSDSVDSNRKVVVRISSGISNAANAIFAESDPLPKQRLEGL